MLTLSGHNPTLREVRAGTQEETKQKPWRNDGYWLLYDMLNYFSYITQTKMSRDDVTHEKMCPQPQCLTDMATDQPDQGNSSVELLPSQVTLGCIKLTISRQGASCFCFVLFQWCGP